MKKFISCLICICVFLSGCSVPEFSSNATEKKQQETPYVYEGLTQEVESSIFVTPISGISDNFIRGIDISSLLSLEEAGVKYYDFAGNEEDLLRILADAGVNYVRVRVWNDPHDENGNGYGGGNCDVNTAAIIGSRAAKYGIKLCVDFHYSDFWADPSKQMSPKAWSKMDIDEKLSAIKSFTKESLNTIIDCGADVGMVQVGNETNSGIAGVKSQDNLYRMIASGCEGVNEIAKERGMDIKTVVHFTQIDSHDDTLKKAELLKEAGAQYDVFGVSYYPYWHGTFENMQQVLKDITASYGVDTCIMETAYPYTAEDGDGFGNSISGDKDILTEYPATVQGQAKALRDVMAYAYEAGAIGVFYWEGAWIPTDSSCWEQYGTGWAGSYSASYDPEDAGKYYGGCSWDNQALFDFEGHPLESLNVFKYVKYGAKAPIEVLAVKDVKIVNPVGVELVMPDSVDAVYNDSALTEGIPVTWDDYSDIDIYVPGKYEITGTAQNGMNIVAQVKIDSVNYVKNGSFDEEDVSCYKVEFEGDADPTDIQNKASDAMSGNTAFHFWSPSALSFDVSQTIEGLHPGNYTASCYIQGGDMGESEKVYLYVLINNEVYATEEVSLTGWVDWKNPTIKDIPVSDGDEVIMGVSVTGDGNGWGTIDDWEFY